ncbi:putative transporter [Skermanella rosea]|uniref:putative transporter n=1 Tax=Skermanella rosea TaxID=1817965 RepID=UPI0019338616|nr:putative transporter [Skermanella rosea]UEM03132.1 putative transporter [Skermanella rosea]
MELLTGLIGDLPAVAQVMLMLCLVAVLGLALGEIRLGGVGLGIGGVLFAGIAVGHAAKLAGVSLDHAMLDFAREFGLILFVYSIGIQVGPGFFSALKRSGLALNLMAAAMVGLGAATAVAIHLAGGLPLPVVLGLFSGAVTNTPSLGAAQQVLKEVGAAPEMLALPSLGYAMAYPFGIAGILITMLAVKALFRLDPAEAARAFEERRRSEVAALETMNVAVRNEALGGRAIGDLPGLAGCGVIVSRMMRDGRLRVPHDGTLLQAGDVLHLVGPKPGLLRMRSVLGPESDLELTTKGTDLAWARVVVTNSQVLGRSIAALNVQDTYDVRISRVVRSGVELVPDPAFRLQFGDIVNVIGTPEHIRQVAGVLGNSERRLQQVHLVPMFLGILLGLLLGSVPLAVPGLPAPLKLGLAGGPLIAAILLARVGHVGPLVWFMPPVANTALRELGIVLFLAVVGFRSGDRFVDTLVHGDGLAWMACGALITIVPLMAVALFAHLAMRLNYLSLCGLLAGSMTDPPALAFAGAMARSEAPALAYATVYPLVMCLRILAPQVMVLLLA